jgi:hypothetical protein
MVKPKDLTEPVVPRRIPLRQAKYFGLSIAFALGTLAAVTLQEEVDKTRRHASIARDIEREKWRAKQLGLEARDDGFADKFIEEKKQRPVTLLDRAAAAKSLE